MALYGFADKDERDIFLSLLSVPGVGPKQGLKVLSSISPLEFVRAVEDGATERLSRVNGLGRKSAEKIILSLKGKLSRRFPRISHKDFSYEPVAVQARAALVSLGYTEGMATSSVEKAISRLGENLNLEELIKEALKSIQTI